MPEEPLEPVVVTVLRPFVLVFESEELEVVPVESPPPLPVPEDVEELEEPLLKLGLAPRSTLTRRNFGKRFCGTRTGAVSLCP